MWDCGEIPGRRTGFVCSYGGQDSLRGAHIVTAILSDSLSSPFASQCVAVVRKGHNMWKGASAAYYVRSFWDLSSFNWCDKL